MNSNHANSKTQRIRKVVGLVILGIALGLVANQLLVSLRHEVTLEINLSENLARDLDGLELRVSEAGSAAEAVSLTRYFFDKYHRPSTSLTHMLNITNGHYDLRFTIQKGSNDETIIVMRALEVSGAAHVSYHLP